jgi:D-erythro-7,8-dihydroneopterin triphosphate epimerase
VKLNKAEIKVKNLRLRTYIGIKQEEIDNLQDIVINLRIQYNATKAARSDSVEDALNYRTITKTIIEKVEHQRFSLLEKLAADVLHIASTDPAVEFAEVEIDKPHALRFADSVSLSLSCQSN